MSELSVFRPTHDRVAVLGGGVMGPGIAQVFAEHGFQVDLCDIHDDAIARGMATLRESIQLKVELGLTPATEAGVILGRVKPQVGIDAAVARARLVIEAISENREAKSAVYRCIADIGAADTAVWSNTSTMNVFELAPDALRPRLVVAHWFAPPHILPLVEVVGGEGTAPATVDECVIALRALGKVPVRLKKFVPGFVINRLQRALGHEAFHLIQSGVIDAEELDAAVRTSLSPRMQVVGLMQRYDFSGLNLSQRNLQDPAFVDAPVDRAPAPLVERVARGELGVSTGKGFYDYAGRSTLDMQRLRDASLWRVMDGLGDLVTDPRPL